MDSHALKGSAVQRRLCRLLKRYVGSLQREMPYTLTGAGFYALPPSGVSRPRRGRPVWTMTPVPEKERCKAGFECCRADGCDGIFDIVNAPEKNPFGFFQIHRIYK